MISKFTRTAARAVGLVLLAFFGLAPCPAQAPPPEKPLIDNIDPPDWFVQLQDPMLLVHGTGLAGARFHVTGRGVTLERSQVSPNGHWAFLWLRTAAAQPQTVQVDAQTSMGSASRPWQLKPRNEKPEDHKGFSPADVIYLVMTDRFADGNPANDDPPSDPGGFNRSAPRGWHGGDFAGLIQHLDYLQSLGVTALWTTPIYDNGAMPDSYHGYAATNLYAVDPHFGTLDDLRRLSAGLHAHGMKLVLDQVPNHIGVRHPWISDPPTPDWFHGTLARHDHSEGDFNNLVDPHAPPASRTKLLDGWFVDAMPDMNQENPLVARYLIQQALWWVETAQIDAIRIDTFPYVDRPFWREYHAALHNAFPDLTTVGEIFNGDPTVTSFFAGGRPHGGIDTGLDTPFDFPVYFALRNVLAKDHPFTELAAILRQDALYPHPERLVHFFGNHDTSRFLTDAHNSMPRLKETLGLMATLRGTPELYSGDEIAMQGGDDPDNRRDFPGGFPDPNASRSGNPGPGSSSSLGNSTAGTSSPGSTNPAPPSAFDPATRTPDQQAAFTWTSALLAARKAHSALTGGQQQDLFADDSAFVYVRAPDLAGCASDHSRELILAAVTRSAQPRTLTLPTAATTLANCTSFQPLAPADSGSSTNNNGELYLQLPAESFTLYSVH